MCTIEPSDSVVVAGAADKATDWASAAPVAESSTATANALVSMAGMSLMVRMYASLVYWDSSITNSRESTSIIINIPPGKMLFVVISRSLWECHMNAYPASVLGLFAIVPEGGVVPVVPPEHWTVVTPLDVLGAQFTEPNVARAVAFGPR